MSKSVVKLFETVYNFSSSRIIYCACEYEIMHVQHSDIDSPRTYIHIRYIIHIHVYVPICMQISSNTTKPICY